MITPRESIELNRQGVRFEPHAISEPPRPDKRAAKAQQARAQRETRSNEEPGSPNSRQYGAGF